jgi:hypothetical protein
MNKDNAHLFRPIYEALINGKTIQQQSPNGAWHDLPEVIFSSDSEKYRIKPEPREFFLALTNHSKSKVAAACAVGSGFQDSWGHEDIIRVREIIEP